MAIVAAAIAAIAAVGGFSGYYCVAAAARQHLIAAKWFHVEPR